MSSPSAKRAGKSTASNPLAGWDISLAALALACMSVGFWRLWPEAANLDRPPMGPVIIKAGLAALGFVALASKWEVAVRGLGRNPLALVFLALACASGFWAITPGEALQQSILLLVLWSFGIGLALRFTSIELAEICGFAGIFGLIMQIAAQQGMPPVSHFDGDLAFALIGCLWAASQIPSRRMIWLIAAGLCAALALAAGDGASLGAAFGFGIGFGLAAYGGMLARQGAVSVLVTAWVLVAGIVAITLLMMFGMAPIGAGLGQYFDNLGPHMVLGQGFGSLDPSIAGSIGGGLGVLGLCVAGLVIMASLCQILFGKPAFNSALIGQCGALCACVGAWALAPTEVAALGPITIIFAATSFAVSLACAPKPVPRAGLLSRTPIPVGIGASARKPMATSSTRARLSAEAQNTDPASSVSRLGLRPRQ
jgi:hypothetical protein